MKLKLYRELVPRLGRGDVYVTCVARAPISDAAGLTEFFQELASATVGTTILHGKIFGLCDQHRTILGAARSIFQQRGLDSDFPATLVEGTPCVGGMLAGMQIVGTMLADSLGQTVDVETIRDQELIVGRRLRMPGYRMVFLAGISGTASAAKEPSSQARRMFHNAAVLLDRQGLGPRHIVRTWIYLPHILHWYGEFNRIRSACFRDLGILGEHGTGQLPASTGIRGKREDGEECFMDVLAITSTSDNAPVAIPMYNVRQNEASEYGSAFSRGMAVCTDVPPTLHVSGTASIDVHGQTAYPGDAQGQIMETLLNVATLIEGHAAQLRDIRQATAYCKDERTYRVFERVISLLGLTGIPFVPVLADVCRDELLFEIDGIAVAATPLAGASAP